MTIQAEQAPINAEIVSALIGCTPEDWRDILLHVERIPRSDGDSHRIRIESPEGRADSVEPSDELMLAIRQMSLLMQRQAHPGKSCSIE